ncbi:antibiotic biosynthesis monooxygenase family protein [Streptomyces griseosporeus]|uniref:antibiotic biosynthesis monooxygenase family protein n=1 Tax=Streptomyces griseosporeus TaxID=1910 RepID=UPI0037908021
MSDHPITAPVTTSITADVPTPVSTPVTTPVTTPAPTPVPAAEPPYYVAVFTSLPTPDQSGYAETADRLGALVRDIPGYMGEDSARTPGGLAISVAYFRDLEGIERWRRDAEHVAAKERGRQQWYERYSLHIARVEHSHTFRRPTT